MSTALYSREGQLLQYAPRTSQASTIVIGVRTGILWLQTLHCARAQMPNGVNGFNSHRVPGMAVLKPNEVESMAIICDTLWSGFDAFFAGLRKVVRRLLRLRELVMPVVGHMTYIPARTIVVLFASV